MSDRIAVAFVLMLFGVAISSRPPFVANERVPAYVGGIFMGFGLALLVIA